MPRDRRAAAGHRARGAAGSGASGAGAPDSRASIWIALGCIVAATFIAYVPAWHGGLVWDDDHHLTAAGLRSIHGLWLIWFQLGATQQYYPVAHSAFWLLAHVAGSGTAAYHLTNITLHATSACLVACILRRVRVPGATLAALIFALHPVHVESVAWMTELKNTLSGALYLASLVVYLRFDVSRRMRHYVVALVLFIAALLSKSVTASLPAALLVVFWWQRGRIRWREDVLPLLPFVGLGIAAGVMTAWVERTYIGASAARDALTFAHRLLLAGRAPWFYLGSLLWPAHLAFVYPRWTLDPSVWWQDVFPLLTAGVLAAFWWIRGRSRAPLACALFFIGTLVPALGFVNVYPFRYSFVADHFQYLASLGAIIPFAACATMAMTRMGMTATLRAGMAVVFLAVPLGALTWQHSGDFVNAETLYRATLRVNPSSGLAQTNLGEMLLEGSPDEAREGLEHLRIAVTVDPSNSDAHNDLGNAWQRLGRFDTAIAEHREAIRLSPRQPVLQKNLGADLAAAGRYPEAEQVYADALALAPLSAETHHDYAVVLQKLGRTDKALDHIHEALRLDPSLIEAYDNLGNALTSSQQWPAAIAAYREGLARAPQHAELHFNLAIAMSKSGDLTGAIPEFSEAVRLRPDSAAMHAVFARVLAAVGRTGDALGELQAATRADPADADLHNALGVALQQAGRTADAIREFREALTLRPDFPAARDNLVKSGGR